jgi:uncharacterized membrane protein
MEAFLRSLASDLALAVEAIAVIVVGWGALMAVASLIRFRWHGAPHGERKAIWRSFGMSLLFGLEFELAADIMRSVISPTWQEIGQLAAIAAIRTFLNYFLEKDLDHAAERAPEA